MFKVGMTVSLWRLSHVSGKPMKMTTPDTVETVVIDKTVKYFTLKGRHQHKFDLITGRMLNRVVGAWNYFDVKPEIND